VRDFKGGIYGEAFWVVGFGTEIVGEGFLVRDFEVGILD
jgi:hypothetical protein